MMTDIKITVLVATRNRDASLARLLDGLAAQANAPPFEVIIGDNGSSDDTIKVIERVRDRLQIHYVYEERPGKSRALNTALKLARGELIVFTDDDVLPQSDWLAQIHVAALRHTDVNIFGGRIEVNLEAVPRWIKRSHNLMGLLTSAHRHGDSDMQYTYGQYPFGPNMAIRRHLLAGLDAPYPEHLGPGTNLPVGDESAFFLLFSSPGAHDRVFVSAAQVFHHVEPENVTFRTALRRCFVAGKGHGQIRLPALSEPAYVRTSTFRLILARLGSCKSFRELTCITVRYLGYLSGSVKILPVSYSADSKISVQNIDRKDSRRS